MIWSPKIQFQTTNIQQISEVQKFQAEVPTRISSPKVLGSKPEFWASLRKADETDWRLMLLEKPEFVALLTKVNETNQRLMLQKHPIFGFADEGFETDRRLLLQEKTQFSASLTKAD